MARVSYERATRLLEKNKKKEKAFATTWISITTAWDRAKFFSDIPTERANLKAKGLTEQEIDEGFMRCVEIEKRIARTEPNKHVPTGLVRNKTNKEKLVGSRKQENLGDGQA